MGCEYPKLDRATRAFLRWRAPRACQDDTTLARSTDARRAARVGARVGWHGQAGSFQPARALRRGGLPRESHGQVEYNLPMPPPKSGPAPAVRPRERRPGA